MASSTLVIPFSVGSANRGVGSLISRRPDLPLQARGKRTSYLIKQLMRNYCWQLSLFHVVVRPWS
ncbi:MAG: hypothetical protein NUK65_01995 [Firmicutes bacterium]|nr:hypothetical protein [Bacillota bacterium]